MIFVGKKGGPPRDWLDQTILLPPPVKSFFPPHHHCCRRPLPPFLIWTFLKQPSTTLFRGFLCFATFNGKYHHYTTAFTGEDHNSRLEIKCSRQSSERRTTQKQEKKEEKRKEKKITFTSSNWIRPFAFPLNKLLLEPSPFGEKKITTRKKRKFDMMALLNSVFPPTP